MLGVQIGAHRAGPTGLDLAQHTDGRADLPWSTLTALEGVVFDKRPLQRVKVLTIGKPLDCDDLGILMCDRESEAAIHAPTIEQNGTGTALPMVAAFLRTGKPQVLAKYVKERRSGIDGKLMRCSIHPQSDGKIHTWCDSL
jgi:hypothetical protein